MKKKKKKKSIQKQSLPCSVTEEAYTSFASRSTLLAEFRAQIEPMQARHEFQVENSLMYSSFEDQAPCIKMVSTEGFGAIPPPTISAGGFGAPSQPADPALAFGASPPPVKSLVGFGAKQMLPQDQLFCSDPILAAGPPPVPPAPPAPPQSGSYPQLQQPFVLCSAPPPPPPPPKSSALIGHKFKSPGLSLPSEPKFGTVPPQLSKYRSLNITCDSIIPAGPPPLPPAPPAPPQSDSYSLPQQAPIPCTPPPLPPRLKSTALSGSPPPSGPKVRTATPRITFLGRYSRRQTPLQQKTEQKNQDVFHGGEEVKKYS